MIHFVKSNLLDVRAEALIYAAREDLKPYDRNSRAVFAAAGEAALTEACSRLDPVTRGQAAVTDGFDSGAVCILHAVNPGWEGHPTDDYYDLIACCYTALRLAQLRGCHSAVLPKFQPSAARYAIETVWPAEIEACLTFLNKNPDWDMEITFALDSDRDIWDGQKELRRQSGTV